MPLTGLPHALEAVLSALLHNQGLSSWRVEGGEENTVIVLRFSPTDEDETDASASAAVCGGCRRKVLSSNNLDQPHAKKLRKEVKTYPFNVEGPESWEKDFPIARTGLRQSPIDIDTKVATFNEKLVHNPLSITYQLESNVNVGNTGLSYMVSCKQPSELQGGPLKDTYRLEQFHFHWGSCDERGSEHTLNGKTFPGELHLVHWNADKYKNFAEAADKPDGLSVLGIFLKMGKKHEGLAALTDVMDKVKLKDNSDTIPSFNPSCLLPKNTSNYWTYLGSLTTPPLYESVTWIVFHEVMEVSKDQIEALRGLCCDCSGSDHIMDNYRPPLALGTRILNASFK